MLIMIYIYIINIEKSIDKLDENNIIPLLEIIKKLFLNTKVKESLITKKSKYYYK